MAFILVQLGLGVKHHLEYRRTQAPSLFGKIHIWTGRIILLLAVLNAFLYVPFDGTLPNIVRMYMLTLEARQWLFFCPKSYVRHRVWGVVGLGGFGRPFLPLWKTALVQEEAAIPARGGPTAASVATTKYGIQRRIPIGQPPALRVLLTLTRSWLEGRESTKGKFPVEERRGQGRRCAKPGAGAKATRIYLKARSNPGQTGGLECRAVNDTSD